MEWEVGGAVMALQGVIPDNLRMREPSTQRLQSSGGDELPLAISWGPDFPGATREAP